MGMYSITPIGSASSGTATVAGAYVDYLQDGQSTPDVATRNEVDGTVAYYAETVEGSAMWSGHGAARLGLVGEVDPEHLKSILQGRHHLSGRRLTTAQGSAGRHGLKVGEPTRLIEEKPVWSLHDLASRFGLDDETLEQVLVETGIGSVRVDGDDFYEIAAVSKLADRLDTAQQKVGLTGGDDGDMFSTGQAAKLLGVSRRYVGSVIAHHQTMIAAGENLDETKLDWLPATRNGRAGRWRIRRDDLIAFAERREPPAVRLAYDVTFTFEKSVSILGLLSDGHVRDVVTQAILDANTVGLAHFDQYASDGRARGRPVGSEGLTVASYVHATSRNNDPFLHVHNVVANVIEDEDGTGRAIDGRKLYLEGPTAAALASAELRWQLNQNLGVTFTATGTGVEIVGIGDEIRDAFSTRSAEVEDLLDNIDATAGERARAAQFTRPQKGDRTIGELFPGWWQTAAGHGFTPNNLEDVEGRIGAYPEQLTASEQAELLTHLGGAAGVTARRSIFTYGDVVRAIGDWTPTGADGDGHVRLLPAVQTRRLADRFLTSSLVVPLDVDKRQVAATAGKVTSTIEHADLFSTRRMLGIHNQIDERWAKGLDGGGAVADPAVLVETLAKNWELTGAQADFVTQWVTSGHRFQSGVGVPGAGKTFAMTAAAQAWEASGFRVVGAAIKGTAARELTAVGVEASTLASIFHRHTRNQMPLDSRTVLLVDEASTIGDEDLHRLLGIAIETGATVRFLGDVEQHQAVPAGGMWSHLVHVYAANTPALTESQRFKDSPVDVAANTAMRAGRIGEAFRLLADAGQLHETNNNTAGYAALLRRAIDTREAGNGAPMIERTNHGRQILNAAMQQIRVDAGDVTEVQEYERHRFGVGDDVIARTKKAALHPDGDRAAYIRRGSTGTVTATTTKQVTVEFDQLGTIHIPAADINQADSAGEDLLQLGYALTSYSVQGSTHPLSTSAVRPGATKAELVVNISRGRRDNQIVLVGNDDAEMARFTEPTSATLTEQVEQSVSPGDSLPAGIVDPTAVDRDMNLARVHNRGTQHGHHVVAIENAQRRALIAAPPADLVDFLPDKPTVPHLRQRWEEAVVTAGLYGARYTPRPNANTPWGYTLGSAPDPQQYPERHQAWVQAIKRLAGAAVEITLRSLDESAIEPPIINDVQLKQPQSTSRTPTRRDVKAVFATVLKLGRITTSQIVDVDHHISRRHQNPSPNVVEALQIRRRELQQQTDANQQLAAVLNTKTVDTTAAIDVVEVAHELAARSLTSAIHRQHRLHDTARTAHPTIQTRVANDLAVHQQQHQLVTDIQERLRQIHANQPTPLEVQRADTIGYRTRTQPDCWLTDHIEQLAHANKLTPAINTATLAEWAGQAAVYKERWNADPLSTKPLRNQAQAGERATLNQLHGAALTPPPDVGIDIDPAVVPDIEIGLIL